MLESGSHTESGSTRKLETVEVSLWCWSRDQESFTSPTSRTQVSDVAPKIYHLTFRVYMTSRVNRRLVDLVHVLFEPIPEELNLNTVAKGIHDALVKKYPELSITKITEDLLDPTPLSRGV